MWNRKLEAAKASKIFSRMAEVGTDLVSSCFGEVGRKMVLLFDVLGNHPEMDGIFFEDQDLDFCELLEMVGRNPRKNALSGKLPRIADMIVSDKFKSSKDPGKNGYAARLLRKPIKDSVRLLKRSQAFGSESLVRSIHKNWRSFPSGFSNFIRNSEPVRDELADSASARFRELGCDHLNSSISVILDRFNNPKSSFGYKRLGVTDAFCVLMKMHGAIPSSIEGAAIPIHFFDSIPPRVFSAIEEAEFNPGLFFDSTFDHYFVVTHSCRGDIGECVSSVVEERVGAAVLGERDGESYFICEWDKTH